ncbi:MAG: 5'/3'-nucleotidase SurE [Desulfitobacterium sp.]|nr:5'/3'-nucleotidase SurE [Desulfitobacterium sp.]
MRILLTNDDGYFAKGIQTMYQVLKEEEEYELYIVAPDTQRSATGHSITLFEPLFLTEHPLEKGTGYAISGKPADCVKIAIQGDIIPKPDLVISGINNGPNLGTDVFYSGTVSAAMEGVLLGIPALAISLAGFSANDYRPAARFLAKFLSEQREKILQQGGLININIPAIPEEDWKGVKITKLGKAVYENVFELRKAPFGREYYWQAGNVAPETDQETDLFAVQEGYVSITPMHSDLTDYAKLKEFQSIFKDL